MIHTLGILATSGLLLGASGDAGTPPASDVTQAAGQPAAAVPPGRPAAGPIGPQQCVDCHRAPTEELHFRDGSSLDLTVDFEAWESSPHGRHISCLDCHRESSELPHPTTSFADAREYRIERSQTCQRCHYAYYAQNLDSTHYAHLKAGNRMAPVCVDCHGAHANRAPSARLAIHRRCATCHREISQAYAASVHGRHLIENENPDVPVCTDCHGTHSIKDPRNPMFHASSHTICARCHGDAERMKRYGLSTYVLTSYLEDFHGRSNQLYAEGAGRPDRPFVSCIDCHGTHDIKSLAGNRQAIRHRVAAVCRRCHHHVPEGFADAWLLHYEPTFASAPIVWAVGVTSHWILVLLLAGLALHFLLHLWNMRTRPPDADSAD